MDKPYATIGLSVVDPGPAPAMHVRVWAVPLGHVEAFAAAMTAQFGRPNEMVSSVDAMTAGADAAAEQGGALFMIAGETP